MGGGVFGDGLVAVDEDVAGDLHAVGHVGVVVAAGVVFAGLVGAGVEVAATAPTASARRSPRVNLVILCFCITQVLVLTIMTTLSFYS